MDTWIKDTHLCTLCDALIEVTRKDEFRNIWHCGGECTLLSVEDGTIKETTTEKEAPMETENTIFTVEYVESSLIEKQQRIEQLEKQLQNVTQRDYTNASIIQDMRDSMQAWTLDELDSCGINQDQAEAIAEICGFELSKEFEVEVTVTFTATVNAKDEEEAQNAMYDIDFDTVDYNTDVVTYMSSNVDSVNI